MATSPQNLLDARIFPPAPLEEWMRAYYFAAEIDLGSSGVQDFSLGEVRELAGIRSEELDSLVLRDSQTLGDTALCRVIAERWDNGDPDRVVPTHGSTEANFLIMRALLRPGDEVMVLDPCYQQLRGIAESLGCTLTRWPLRAEDGFVPDVGEARRRLSPRVRMVVVNFPHNPTGATLTPDGQAELIGAVEEAGCWLVWDGAFHELTHDDPPLPWPNRLSRRVISTGTLSKTYGLPGLRLGWCIGASEVLRRFIDLRDYTTLHLSPLNELIARRVIESADRFLDLRRRMVRANLERIEAWAAERRAMIEWTPPRGGVCGFPRLPQVPDVDAFCHTMGREHKVLLVPGSCFDRPDRVRLGGGGSPDKLAEGLDRFHRCLHQHRRG